MVIHEGYEGSDIAKKIDNPRLRLFEKKKKEKNKKKKNCLLDYLCKDKKSKYKNCAKIWIKCNRVLTWTDQAQIYGNLLAPSLIVVLVMANYSLGPLPTY